MPDTPYARVTVLAPRHRVDVALPADVPVGDLVPMVLELLGEPPPGHRPRPWRLTGVTGGRLHAGATLDELGVLDGELLRIGPEVAPPPPPVFDDPVDALAATAGAREVTVPGPGAVVPVVLAVAAAALLAAVPSPDPDAAPWASAAAVAALLGACAALTRAALLVRRGAERAAAGTAALAAVPLAAAAGATAVAGVPGGAPLLLACACAGIAAAAGQAVLRVVRPVLVGVVVVAVPTVLAAAAHLRLGAAPGALAAAVGGLALVAGPLLPRLALRLAGLPRPVVPADAGELRDADGADVLPPAELAARAELARGHLAGLVGGVAVLAGASALPAATTGGWTGPALAVVIVVVLGLRARGFADPAPARTLLTASLAAGIGLAALAAVAGGPATRLAVAAAVLMAATIAVAVGGTAPAASPVARRAVDLLEGVLVALAVPLALGAMGMYALVRGL